MESISRSFIEHQSINYVASTSTNQRCYQNTSTSMFEIDRLTASRVATAPPAVIRISIR